VGLNKINLKYTYKPLIPPIQKGLAVFKSRKKMNKEDVWMIGDAIEHCRFKKIEQLIYRIQRTIGNEELATVEYVTKTMINQDYKLRLKVSGEVVGTINYIRDNEDKMYVTCFSF
jgi:hypothetical protein